MKPAVDNLETFSTKKPRVTSVYESSDMEQDIEDNFRNKTMHVLWEPTKGIFRFRF